MINPDRFDIAIIGAGPGGNAAALEAHHLGARVLLVERDQPGGTCLNWGCIPTKALLASADALHRAQMAQELGLLIPEASPDWPALLARRDKVVDRLVQAHHQEYRREKIDYRQAEARIEGPGRLQLTNAGGETTEVEYGKLIIATGSRPGALPGIEPDGVRVLNSDHALTMASLPEDLLVIGGGVIGCEFASLFADLGVQVTLVEMLPRLLALTGCDADLSTELQRSFKKRKIKLHLDVTMQSLNVSESGVEAALSNGKTINASQALLSVGRRLNTDGLGLEAVGIHVGVKGEIPVNDHLESAVEGIFAIGDVTGQPQLAHLAIHHGIAAARNALEQTPRGVDLASLPSVIFTHPCVANVGLSEAAATERGLDVAVGKWPMRQLGKAHASGELDGLVKIVAERGSGRIVGAHMIGAGTEEMIGEMTLAVRLGLTLDQLADTIHAHPTMSEGIWEAVRAALA